MKLPIVLRKTYEIEKENIKKINEQRILAEKKNKKYQIKIIELEREKDKIYKDYQELIKQMQIVVKPVENCNVCKKCGEIYTSANKKRKYCDKCRRIKK